ncbi:MAG TPA: 16S rRNA (guanine(966)-N(2))-methyltransferase RsmD [Burkholderiaceae bacterium]
MTLTRHKAAGGRRLADGSLARAPQRVRIIGGRYRRTPIPVIDAPGLRPTPDRVRETLFNWLTHLLADLAAVRGLDLFAGSGALGFELASRGARRVVLVERNPRLVEQLHRLRERLGAGEVEIVAADWLAAVGSLAPGSFELVFLDPPFDAGLMPAALSRARGLLAPQGLIYAEADAPVDPGQALACGLEVVRSARAGMVHFHLLRALAS